MKSKINRTARDQKIIDAIAEHLSGSATITLGGVAYKAKDLQSQFQAEIAAAKTTLSAKTAWDQAVLAEEKTITEVTALYKALKAYVIGTYGATSAVVADFGFTPKTTTPSVATKAQAIEQRAATRKARGTLGKKERLEITGAAPAVINGAPAAPVATNGAPPKPATAG
jgi:hypothetical protein